MQFTLRHFSLNQRLSHRRLWTIFLLAMALMVPAQIVYAETIIKLAHVGGPDGAIGRGGYRFADNLEKVSNGEMKVQVIIDGKLGFIPELWAQMQAGALDMQVIDLAAISLFKEAQAMQVSVLPYLFVSQDHFRSFTKAMFTQELLTEIRTKTGIRYLGIVEDRSPRIVSTTKRPVNSVADMKNLKIRVPGHPMYIKVFKHWGAIPTPMNPGEMFMALKTGMVEGEDNGVINLADSSNREVIKYVSQIDWSRSGVAAWISEITWEKLSDQEKLWVNEATLLSEDESQKDYAVNMASAVTKLEELGISIETVDVSGFKSATTDFHKQFEGDIWPQGLVEKIMALSP